MINQIEENRVTYGSGGRGPGVHYDLRRCDSYHTDYTRFFTHHLDGGSREAHEAGRIGLTYGMACLKDIRGFGRVRGFLLPFYVPSSL